MLKGDFSTEKAQASHIGKKVVSAKQLTAGDYTEEGQKARRTNARGYIVDYSNSHGLCYAVRHEDGTKAWYDPDELSEFKGEAINRMSVLDFTKNRGDKYITPEAIEKALDSGMPRENVHEEVLRAMVDHQCVDPPLCAFVAVSHMKV